MERRTFETKQVRLSYIEASGSFWLQLADDTSNILEDVETHLKAVDFENHPNYQLVSPPRVNLRYVARHPNNGNWQRANIISVSDRTVEVFFLDYGEWSFMIQNCLTLSQTNDFFLH